ncbi:MAG: hypothetical protein AAF138_02935 [Planctomycetota bacterium]
MQDIRRVLRQAAGRLLVMGFFNWLAWSLSAALAAVIVARLLDRLVGLAVDYTQVVWIAAVSAIVAALIGALVTRPREAAVARVVDEKANLNESLSTALFVEKDESAWSRAVIETAGSRASGVKVRSALPIEAPRRWPAPMSLAMALVVIWFAVPALDLSGNQAEAAERERTIEEAERVEQEVAAAEERIEELLDKAGLTEGEGDEIEAPTAEDLKKPVKPEEIRRAAIKRMTNLGDRLAREADGEKAKQIEALKDRLAKLRQPGPGPLNEMSRSMARGNFAGAKERLEQLAEQLAQGELSEQQQRQLKRQFEGMAKQLDKLAEDKQQLAEELKKAGVDAKKAEQLAQNPEQIQQALEQLQNMSPEQMEQLVKEAQAQQMASQQLSNMAGAMSQMAQGQSEQGMNQEGMEGMDGMGNELSEAESLQQDMQSLDAAMDQVQQQLTQMGQGMGEQEWGQCQAGEGQGLGLGEGPGSYSQGLSQSQGLGSGGPGQGQGAGPDEQAADFVLEKEKANVKTVGGPIIASRLVYGDQVRGESVAEFSEAVSAARVEASDAIETNVVPRELHGAVKSYFGTLERKARENAIDPADRPAAPPAPDAEDAG